MEGRNNDQQRQCKSDNDAGNEQQEWSHTLHTLNSVDDTPYRLYIGWLGGIEFDFFAQSPDMEGNSTFVAVKFVSPDLIEQLRTAKNLLWMLRQKPQQIELFGGQVDQFIIERYCPP